MEAERELLKMLKDGTEKRIPKQVRRRSRLAAVGRYPIKAAQSLVGKGILQRVGMPKDQRFKIASTATIDALIKTLAPYDADLELDHVEPAGVLGRVVELQTPQDPTRLGRRKGLIDG